MLGIAGTSFALNKPKRLSILASSLFYLALTLFGIHFIKNSTKILIDAPFFEQIIHYTSTYPLIAFAAGFIFLIYDGQRSIADQTVRLTRLGEFWNDINQASQQSLQALVEARAPWLWESAGKFILNQPTWAVLGVLGILLMLLFRPKKRLIGYARD